MGVLLEVKNLKTQFNTEAGLVKAVDGVSYHINEHEIVGMVGESGCGKSVSQLSVMQLIPSPPGKIAGGEVWFDGKNLLQYPANGPEMRHIRGSKISMIFQEPMTSLNPVFRVGEQIAEAIRLHQNLPEKQAMNLSVELLDEVGIPDPQKRSRDYPHNLSGGMRQRVMIAMAMSCHPQLLLADEPTTALDVTIQAQILDLISNLKQKNNMAVILITHDLGVIAQAAQNVAVMYAGKIVECTAAETIFTDARHPYTQGLLESMPGGCVTSLKKEDRLKTIPGSVPSLYDLTPGCLFHDRCSYAMEVCSKNEPPLTEIEHGHFVSCWKYRADGK